MSRMSELLVSRYLGQPIAILCARYWYRGILVAADDDTITLTYPRAVEVTGPATRTSPQSEDIMPSDLHISTGAIEMMAQPLWVFHEMPNIKGVRKARKIMNIRNENVALLQENAKMKDEVTRAKADRATTQTLQTRLEKAERELAAMKSAKGK